MSDVPCGFYMAAQKGYGMKRSWFLIVLCLPLLLCGCAQKSAEREFFAMDTVMQLRAGSPAPLTPGQEYASPALLQSGNPLVGAYLARVETALIATVEGLTGAEKQRPERLAYFSQALHEIQEMRKHYGDNS